MTHADIHRHLCMQLQCAMKDGGLHCIKPLVACFWAHKKSRLWIIVRFVADADTEVYQFRWHWLVRVKEKGFNVWDCITSNFNSEKRLVKEYLGPPLAYFLVAYCCRCQSARGLEVWHRGRVRLRRGAAASVDRRPPHRHHQWPVYSGLYSDYTPVVIYQCWYSWWHYTVISSVYIFSDMADWPVLLSTVWWWLTNSGSASFLSLVSCNDRVL